MVSVFRELGVPDQMPALNAPAISYQLQQGFWSGAQARVKQMSGTEWLTVTGTGDRQLHYPAGSAPVLTDVPWCLFCSQRPGDAASVADLVIACHERDVTLSLKLGADLAMQRLPSSSFYFFLARQSGPVIMIPVRPTILTEDVGRNRPDNKVFLIFY